MINTPFIEKFRECVTEFYNKKYSDFSAEVLKLEGIRKKFVLDFRPEILPTLTLREFTSGNNNTTSFCNRLETELQKLGEMHGAYVNKFGVYYSNIRHQYECTKIWSKTKDYNEGLSRLELAICRLLQDGKNRDYEAISKSKISHLFKSKILATYYPEIYLNVYSEESVREFLKILFLQYDDELTIEQNKLKLFVAKDYDERLTKLDNLMLIKFLYWYKDKLKNYADKSLWKKGFNMQIQKGGREFKTPRKIAKYLFRSRLTKTIKVEPLIRQ